MSRYILQIYGDFASLSAVAKYYFLTTLAAHISYQ